jgi:hypothetical protein
MQQLAVRKSGKRSRQIEEERREKQSMSDYNYN